MVEGLRRVVRAAFVPLRGRDLSLHAAAITFYGAIAVVPVALLAIWLTSLIAGADRVRRLAGYAVETLPASNCALTPSGAFASGGSGAPSGTRSLAQVLTREDFANRYAAGMSSVYRAKHIGIVLAGPDFLPLLSLPRQISHPSAGEGNSAARHLDI